MWWTRMDSTMFQVGSVGWGRNAREAQRRRGPYEWIDVMYTDSKDTVHPPPSKGAGRSRQRQRRISPEGTPSYSSSLSLPDKWLLCLWKTLYVCNCATQTHWAGRPITWSDLYINTHTQLCDSSQWRPATGISFIHWHALCHHRTPFTFLLHNSQWAGLGEESALWFELPPWHLKTHKHTTQSPRTGRTWRHTQANTSHRAQAALEISLEIFMHKSMNQHVRALRSLCLQIHWPWITAELRQQTFGFVKKKTQKTSHRPDDRCYYFTAKWTNTWPWNTLTSWDLEYTFLFTWYLLFFFFNTRAKKIREIKMHSKRWTLKRWTLWQIK